MYAVAIVISCFVGQEPVSVDAAKSAQEVRALVRELDAPQKSARDDAEQKLIERGPAVLKQLPKPGASISAEAATRLNRVRSALYRAAAEASLKASQLTFDVRDAPLSEVLAAFEKQSGNRLIDYRRQFGQQVSDVRVTLKLEKREFWPALDDLLATTGLEVYPFTGEDGLALVSAALGDGGAKTSPTKTQANVAYSGAFRIEAVEMVASRRLRDEEGSLQINLAAAWEPRLKPMFLNAAMAKIEALDDAGKPIDARNPELLLEIPPQGKANRVDISLPFIAPARGAVRVGKLRGTFEVLLPAELHEFRFTALDGGRRQTQDAAAVSVSLEVPRMNNDLLEVPLRIGYDRPGKALESHRAWFYKNPAFLESADGKQTAPGTIELARQSDNEIVLNLLFAAPDDWARQTLVYRTPADIVAVPVTFEFRDLPLP